MSKGTLATMDCNLICQMQVRMNDVKLDDKPKLLTEDPTDESHAISCEDNTGKRGNIILPHKKEEFENCPRIELTYLSPEWDPHSYTFQEQEEALMNNKGKLHEWSNKRKDVDRYISMFDNNRILSKQQILCVL